MCPGSGILVSLLELRKRHMDGCPKFSPERPFSTNLNCKRCPYFAYGKLGSQKIRQSLDTTDRPQAAARRFATSDVRQYCGIVVGNGSDAGLSAICEGWGGTTARAAMFDGSSVAIDRCVDRERP